jgi:hypothetical protein
MYEYIQKLQHIEIHTVFDLMVFENHTKNHQNQHKNSGNTCFKPNHFSAKIFSQHSFIPSNTFYIFNKKINPGQKDVALLDPFISVNTKLDQPPPSKRKSL